MKVSESAVEIQEIIKRAIAKHEITTEEYEQILSIADRDGHIDQHERSAIAQLRDMISSRDIKIIRKD
jgi:uncharacterized membrane protein YebE (DUF533 family)